MKQILIIDDDPQVRSTYRDLLAGEGFDVLTASSVVEAYSLLGKEEIDLVLLDIYMPEIDGSALYEMALRFNRKVKVIISSVCPLYRQELLIYGAHGYFDKSEGIDVLLDKIENVLSVQ